MSITSVKSGSGGISLALDNNYMEPIATTVVGSTAVGIITFNDIPQGYKHLQIRCMARSNRSASGEDTSLIINGDSSANYAWHYIYGDGTSATAAASTSTTNILTPSVPAASATSGIFGAMIIDILDYSNTNKYKTIRSLGGEDRNGSGDVELESGLWMSTNAITSISIFPRVLNSFVQYSRFSLYGIKG